MTNNEGAAPPAIRDEDLIAELKEYEGRSTYAIMQKELGRRQAKRDREAKAARAIEKLPVGIRRRTRARIQVESEKPSADYLRFLPTPLAICSLPYRALPSDVTRYERRQGKMSLVVSSGTLMAPNGEWTPQPVPWGPKARLIMAHLSTEALRNQSSVVETGASFSEFMREIGFEPTGGREGNIRHFKDQLRALAACRMTFGAWDGNRSATMEMKPLEKVELWYEGHPDQRSLSPNTIQFSESFYTQLKKHALPIDVRALKAFSNSARKLDLLFWITYRATRLDEPLILDWKPLKEQFGEGISRDRKFREQLTEDLAAIKEVFPKLPIKLTTQGLEMNPTDPSLLALPKKRS